MSVLCGILLDGSSALKRVYPFITADDFAASAHKHIFSAAVELDKEQATIDVVTVHIWLVKAGLSQDSGSLVYLNDIYKFAPSSHNIELYAGYLKAFSNKVSESNVIQFNDPYRERLTQVRDWFVDQANNPEGHLAALTIAVTGSGALEVKGCTIGPSHAELMLGRLDAVKKRLERIAGKQTATNESAECKVISIFGGKDGAA